MSVVTADSAQLWAVRSNVGGDLFWGGATVLWGDSPALWGDVAFVSSAWAVRQLAEDTYASAWAVRVLVETPVCIAWRVRLGDTVQYVTLEEKPDDDFCKRH